MIAVLDVQSRSRSARAWEERAQEGEEGRRTRKRDARYEEKKASMGGMAKRSSRRLHLGVNARVHVFYSACPSVRRAAVARGGRLAAPPMTRRNDGDLAAAPPAPGKPPRLRGAERAWPGDAEPPPDTRVAGSSAGTATGRGAAISDEEAARADGAAEPALAGAAADGATVALGAPGCSCAILDLITAVVVGVAATCGRTGKLSLAAAFGPWIVVSSIVSERGAAERATAALERAGGTLVAGAAAEVGDRCAAGDTAAAVGVARWAAGDALAVGDGAGDVSIFRYVCSCGRACCCA